MADSISRETISASEVAAPGVVSNEAPDNQKIAEASRIIAGLQHELEELADLGSGPFAAAIYDAEGNLVAKMPNTVTLDNCSHNHAEMNAIKAAEEKLGTYDLSPFHLKLYSTSEPCLMCMGGIMWSGNPWKASRGLMKAINPDGWKSLGNGASSCTATLSVSWASRCCGTMWRKAKKYISRPGRMSSDGFGLKRKCAVVCKLQATEPDFSRR